MDYNLATKVIEFLIEVEIIPHISFIAKRLKEHPVKVHRVVKELEKEGILRTQPAGRSHLVFLNKNPKIIGILTLQKSMSETNPDKFIQDAKETYEKIEAS